MKYYRFVKRNIPFINLFVSSTALLFQITVLNPWHKKISDEINKMDKRILDNNIILEKKK